MERDFGILGSRNLLSFGGGGVYHRDVLN